MSEPNDLTPRPLVELREAVKAGFDRAAFGEALVGRYMAAEVEESSAAPERRLAALEGKH